MGKTHKPGTIIVCPICLLEAGQCKAFAFANAYRFEEDPSKGITRSQALFMRHKDFCPTCCKSIEVCKRREEDGIHCMTPHMHSWERFPGWWKPEEIERYKKG